MVKYLISFSLLLFCLTSEAFTLMTKADININDSLPMGVTSAKGRGMHGSVNSLSLLCFGAE